MSCHISKDGKVALCTTSSDLIQAFSKVDYISMTHIIWDKGQISNRASFGSFKSPSCPSFPTPFEHILVFGYLNKSYNGGARAI